MLGKPKKLYCCERCQNYWSCEAKWYRGEHGSENVCCPLCTFFSICWKDIPYSDTSQNKGTHEKKK